MREGAAEVVVIEVVVVVVVVLAVAGVEGVISEGRVINNSKGSRKASE